MNGFGGLWMYHVAERSIEVYKYLLSNFTGTINDDMRKRLAARLEKSEKILKKRNK